MGFAVRLAPGVRISASRRGLRAGIGPRAARVHVGGGRTSLSTGAGPFTYWTSVGHQRRRRTSAHRSGPTQASLAAARRAARAAQTAGQIAQLSEAVRHLVSRHLVDQPAAGPPTFEPPDVVTADQVRPELLKAALAGLSVFNRSARKAARAEAEAAAVRLAAERTRANEAARAAEIAEADEHWRLLLGNDAHSVMGALEAAFADNESPAAPIDCEHGVATVLVLYPGLDIIPERKPAVTPGGAATVGRRSKTERCELYLEAMGSTVLATVREAYSVAPRLAEVRVVVVRRAPGSGPGVEPVYAGRFPASTVAAWAWDRLRPGATLLGAQGCLIRLRGQAREVVGLDLSGEPDLARVVAAVTASLAEDRDGR